MFALLLTTISSCKSSSPEIQIEPEFIFIPDSLLPEIKNRLLKLCKIDNAEIKNIKFSVFGTSTFKGTKYVIPQSSFSYFNVNHLLVSKKASQIEVKMGKKGVTNNNELQMYFQNKEVTNTFLQEILNSIKKSKGVFNGELQNVFAKIFDLKFYEAINDNEDSIRNAVDKVTGLEERFKEIIIRIINKENPNYYVEVEENVNSRDIKNTSYLVKILNDIIISDKLVIQELFEVQNDILTFENTVIDAINAKIRDNLLLEEKYKAESNMYYGRDKFEKIELSGASFWTISKIKDFKFFDNIIKPSYFDRDFIVFISQLKSITEIAKRFKRLHEFVKTGWNKQSTKQNVEEYEKILGELKNDTGTTHLIENHINLIKVLIKHSNEQTRIFNLLNDESIAFNCRITFKDSNGQIQSVVSKYYTIKEEVLYLIEELRPTPPGKPVKYTGILNNPWFYISLLVTFVVSRIIVMYFMSRRRYSLP